MPRMQTTFFLLLVLVNVRSTVMHIPNPSDTREPDYTVVLDLVKKLHGFPLIIHFDSRSHTSKLLSELSKEVRSRYMWNYDMQTSFHRNCGQRYIHIVDLSNLVMFENNFSSYENVFPWEIVIFLVRQKSVPGMFLDKLSHVTGIFVVTLADSKLFSCSYRNCTLKETEIEKISLKSIFGGFTLRGMIFRVGYLTNAPYVYQRTNSNGIQKMTGSEIYLLHMLSKLKRFRYKLVGVNHYNGSKYSTMLENLEKGKISWAIGGINQNIDRTRKYEFLRYIRLEGMTAMFYKFEDTHPLITLCKSGSFQRTSLLVVCCMISLFLMEHVSNRWFGNTRNDKIVYILIIVAPLMEQVYAPKRMFKKNPVKFLLLVWCVSCCLISATCKNYLLTSYISSSHKSMTMLDLIRDGYRFKSSEDDYWYIQQSCANSPQCIGVKARYSFDHLCKSSSLMKSEKLALIGEKHALNFKILRECDILSPAEKSKVKFADDSILGAEWQSWAMRKHFVFTQTFTKIVSQLEAAGILEIWSRNDIDPKYTALEHVGRSAQRTYRPLDMKGISTSFTLLLVGFLISLLVFSKELLIKINRLNVGRCVIIRR